MKLRTALVAHPFPIVVEALTPIVAAAGYAVSRAVDAAAVTAALRAGPDFVVIAACFAGQATTREDASPALVIAETEQAGAISLTAPVEELGRAVAAAAATQRGGTATSPLTPRERDVAGLVAAGRRNRAIATALGISEGTVKMHLHNVYAKLGLESRTQLAMAAAALGAR